jgi:hypothetical protein
MNNADLKLLAHSHWRQSINWSRLFPYWRFLFLSRAIGVGAVQANIAVFGAEQSQESKITSRFFDRYFVGVNLGAIVATLCVPLIQTDSMNTSSANSYFYGYLIAICMLIGAASLFICGRRYYIRTPPYDTVIKVSIPVIINAFHTWRQYRRSCSASNVHHRGPSMRCHGTDQDGSMRINQSSPSFLDFAKAANNGKFPDRIVDDVKSLRRAATVFLLLIPYWLIYYQVERITNWKQVHWRIFRLKLHFHCKDSKRKYHCSIMEIKYLLVGCH